MIRLLILMIFVVFLGACQKSYQTMDAEAAQALLKEDDTAVLLDVRRKEECDQGHIEGSLLVPLDDLKTNITAILPDKDVPIIIYCEHGTRSLLAIEILSDLGYTALYDLGGLDTWPYDLTNEPCIYEE